MDRISSFCNPTCNPVRRCDAPSSAFALSVASDGAASPAAAEGAEENPDADCAGCECCRRLPPARPNRRIASNEATVPSTLAAAPPSLLLVPLFVSEVRSRRTDLTECKTAGHALGRCCKMDTNGWGLAPIPQPSTAAAAAARPYATASSVTADTTVCTEIPSTTAHALTNAPNACSASSLPAVASWTWDRNHASHEQQNVEC